MILKGNISILVLFKKALKFYYFHVFLAVKAALDFTLFVRSWVCLCFLAAKAALGIGLLVSLLVSHTFFVKILI